MRRWGGGGRGGIYYRPRVLTVQSDLDEEPLSAVVIGKSHARHVVEAVIWLEYRPCGHWRHVAEPTLGWKYPGAQSKHAENPLNADLPAKHTLQNVNAVDPPKVPKLQLLQAEFPVRFWNVPNAQVRQPDVPGTAYFPTSHIRHTVIPEPVVDVPGGQKVQLLAHMVVFANLPISQLVHAGAPTAEYCPTVEHVKQYVHPEYGI